jgi:hypothetical protein
MKTADDSDIVIAQFMHGAGGCLEDMDWTMNGAKQAELSPRKNLVISHGPKLSGSRCLESLIEMPRPRCMRRRQPYDFESFHCGKLARRDLADSSGGRSFLSNQLRRIKTCNRHGGTIKL